jgi:hypothetical protein
MAEKNVIPLDEGRHQVAMPERNPWERYGDEVNRNRIVGEMLKFSKGEWLVGRDGVEVLLGTKFVAGVDAMQVGWTKWEEGRPTDTVMGYLRDGYRVPRRSEMGDTDSEEWPLDDRNGKPRDPWQFSNRFILMDASDQLFTFPTQSAGGVDACSTLASLYGKHVRAKPRELPVIALDRTSYMHPIRERGKIWKPIFRLVNWTDRKRFDAALKAEAEANVEDEGAQDEQQYQVEAPVETKRRASEKAQSYADVKGRAAPAKRVLKTLEDEDDTPF